MKSSKERLHDFSFRLAFPGGLFQPFQRSPNRAEMLVAFGIEILKDLGLQFVGVGVQSGRVSSFRAGGSFGLLRVFADGANFILKSLG